MTHFVARLEGHSQEPSALQVSIASEGVLYELSNTLTTLRRNWKLRALDEQGPVQGLAYGNESIVSAWSALSWKIWRPERTCDTVRS